MKHIKLITAILLIGFSTACGNQTYEKLMQAEPDGYSSKAPDSQTPSVVITETDSSTTVTEGGASDTYTIALGKKPAAAVTIALNTDAQLNVSPASLTFTTDNYNIAQTITVTAVDDSTNAGDRTSVITHTVTGSSEYAGLSANNVSVSIIEDDIPVEYMVSYQQGSNTSGPFKTGNLTIVVALNEAVAPAPVINIDQPGSADITAAAMVSQGLNVYSYVYSIIEDDGSGYQDGSATVTVDATGSNGMAAVPSGSNTFTIDTKAPQVSSVTGNPASGSYRNSDSVNIEVVFDESIILGGGSAELALADVAADAICASASADRLSCLYVVGAAHSSADLNYATTTALTLASGVTIKDAAGNQASLTLPATASASSLSGTSNIRIDNTAPALTTVSIASNNVNTSLAKPGDTVTVSITANEDLQTPTVTIAGATASVTGSGSSYNASYALTAAETEGNVAFQISFRDIAGNNGTVVSAVTDSSSVLFDKTAPVIESYTLDTNNSFIDVTFSEPVYGGSGTAAIDKDDFNLTFAANAGTASDAIIASATKTSGAALTGAESTIRLNLTITGIADGSESISISPVAGAIFDEPGNNALSSTTTGNVYLNAANVANIVSGTLAADNSYVTVEFDEGVYSSAGSGAVEASDFQVVYTANSSPVVVSATPSSVTNNTGGALTGGETQVRVYLNITGTPSGIETVSIKPADGSSIYSLSGAVTPLTNTTAELSLGDILAPTVTAVSSAKSNGTYGTSDIIDIQVTFSENINVTGTPQLELETGTTDIVLDFAAVTGGNTITFNYTVETGHVNADLDYTGDSALTLNGGTIKDDAGNNATLTLPNPGDSGSLAANKDIEINANYLSVTAAKTLDVNSNGKIDHYQLTFSNSVIDNTFPGYNNNSTTGNAQTVWSVFGYANVRIDPTVSGDVENDNIIYLIFDEGPGYDTGIKPNITTSINAGLKDSYNNPMQQVGTLSITEADGAAAIITAVNGTINTSRLTVAFSEAVYTQTGAPTCGSGANLTVADFSYTDSGNGAASAIASMGTDTCGTDNNISLTLNNSLISGDNADSIAVAADQIYDMAGNASTGAAVNPTLVNGPSLISAEAVKYNKIHIVYDTDMVSGSGSGSAECTGGTACFDKYKIPGITITSAVAADAAWAQTPGTAASRYILTTSEQQEGILYDLTITVGSVARNSDGITIPAGANTASFYGDGIPVVSSSSDSNCTDVYIQFDQAMTTGSGTSTENVDHADNYEVSACSGTSCTSPYDAPPVVANAVSWNSMTQIATVSFSTAMNSADVYTLSVKNATDDHGNAVASGTSTSINGCNAPDTVKPTLVDASAADDTHVLLTFSEAVDQSTAESTGNYTITGLTISTAVRQANNTQVLLTTSQQGGGSYTVVVANIEDSNGNAINENGIDNIQPFIGAGSSGIPQDFDDGHIYEDPFNDGVTAGQIFVYNGKLNLGPSTSHGSVFEMTYDMGTSSTITLDADSAVAGAQAFAGLTYNLGTGINIDAGSSSFNCDGTSSRNLEGIDFFYAACSGGTSTPDMTGSECSAASGTEYVFVGGFFNGQGGCYSDVWMSADKGGTRVFDHIGGLSSGGVTYRSANMIVFKEQLYVAQGVLGTGAVRFTRMCLSPGGCSNGDSQYHLDDLSGNGLRRLGRAGSLKNSSASGSYMVAIDSMWVHDTDGSGSNESQLYIANGGWYSGALGAARVTTSDGGILRTNLTYSTAANPPENSQDTRWEDITPDTNSKWNTYMSIALPRDNQAGKDWSFLTPADKFTPAIKAIPYIRTAPNGDLYLIRNACSSNTFHNVADGNFASNNYQTCTQGAEVPQIWMLPKGASTTAADWVLVAENGSTGKSNMSGNTAANQCGSAPNKCADNEHITLLEFNGDYMYVGYDNAVSGLNIWRTDMSSITSGTAPLETAFSLVSPGFGLGDSTNSRIFNHLTINDGSTDYVVVVTRDGSNAVKIYRTNNN